MFVNTRTYPRELRSARTGSGRVARNARARRAMYQNPRAAFSSFPSFSSEKARSEALPPGNTPPHRKSKAADQNPTHLDTDFAQSRNERLKNKMRKSEITTRMKKVFLKAEALKAASACTDEDVGELESLISQATKAVDKAVGKGVLHKNTGARRKSRMSKYKQELRREKGLLTA